MRIRKLWRETFRTEMNIELFERFKMIVECRTDVASTDGQMTEHSIEVVKRKIEAIAIVLTDGLEAHVIVNALREEMCRRVSSAGVAALTRVGDDRRKTAPILRVTEVRTIESNARESDGR